MDDFPHLCEGPAKAVLRPAVARAFLRKGRHHRRQDRLHKVSVPTAWSGPLRVLLQLYTAQPKPSCPVSISALLNRLSSAATAVMCVTPSCRDGQSRQFGFVGFRSVAEAQAAVKYFNRSFMGAQRLTVEFAEKYGGSHLPRAWSKYTEGTSRYKKLHQVDSSVPNQSEINKGDGQQ